MAVAAAAARELAPSHGVVLTLWGLLARPQTVRFATGHTHEVRSMAWPPDGRRLVTVGDDGSVCTWNRTGTLVSFTSVPPLRNIRAAALTPDGTRLLTVDRYGQVALWDNAATGARRLAHASFTASASKSPSHVPIAWSPDGHPGPRLDQS